MDPLKLKRQILEGRKLHATVKEASIILGVSVRTLKMWLERGWIKALKYAEGCVRIPIDELESICNLAERGITVEKRALQRKNRTVWVDRKQAEEVLMKARLPDVDGVQERINHALKD